MVIEQKYKVKQNYILRLLIGSFQKVILGFSYRDKLMILFYQ